MRKNAPARVLTLVNVSTSLSIVRFLVARMEDWCSPLDVCLYSVLVIICSHLYGVDYQLLLLSRRLSYLMLVERIRPFTRIWQSARTLLHIQSVIVNVGIIIILSLVPERWAKSAEGSIIVTAVQYMFADIFDFLADWDEAKFSVLAVAGVVMWWLTLEQQKGNRSHLCMLALEIISSIVVNVVIGVLLGGAWGNRDLKLLYLMISITLAHGASCIVSVAEPTRDFMVFSVASVVSEVMGGNPILWASVLLPVIMGMGYWPGPNVWATHCALIVFVNLLVGASLGYIHRLAVYDTFVTLKTAALVLQFALHEAALLVQGAAGGGGG